MPIKHDALDSVLLHASDTVRELLATIGAALVNREREMLQRARSLRLKKTAKKQRPRR